MPIKRTRAPAEIPATTGQETPTLGRVSELVALVGVAVAWLPEVDVELAADVGVAAGVEVAVGLGVGVRVAVGDTGPPIALVGVGVGVLVGVAGLSVPAAAKVKLTLLVQFA